jgi:hypothetical protein
MRIKKKQLLLLVLFFVVTFLVVNVSFPISNYLNRFNYSRWYVVSSFLLLTFAVTLFTAIALPFSQMGRSSIWGNVTVATALQFSLVSVFSIACSGLGFGWSLSNSTILGRLGFFFAEYEFLRFIFEAAIPLAVCAAFLYWLAGRMRFSAEESSII